MCRFDVEGRTVTATWDSEVSRHNAVVFMPGHYMGERAGSPITMDDLGEPIATLVKRWRASVPRGTVRIGTRKTASFIFNSAEDAQAGLHNLYELVKQFAPPRTQVLN